jgi:penicillin-binding protein 2
VVLDPANGEVLGLTSHPAYDPNAFAAGIDRTAWASLNNDRDRPLNDRALQGRYSPGRPSRWRWRSPASRKGDHAGVPRLLSGPRGVLRQDFACWRKSRGGHGSIDLRRAIRESCDVYFYTVGNMLGVDRINKWATALGLGVKTGIDLPNELQGLVPSTEWKRQARKEKWYSGETISVAIGQGQVSVTPVSMAVYVSALANGGDAPDAAPAQGGRRWQRLEAGVAAEAGIEAGHRSRHDAGRPRRDVDGGQQTPAGRAAPRGSKATMSPARPGRRRSFPQGRQAAKGKTDRNLNDHGWFVFFAPRDKPESPAWSSSSTVSTAATRRWSLHHIVDTFFAKKEGRPLPPKPVLKPNMNPSMG